MALQAVLWQMTHDMSLSFRALGVQVWAVWSGCKQPAGDTHTHTNPVSYEIISNSQKSC